MLVKFKCPACGDIVETKRWHDKECLCHKAFLRWRPMRYTDPDDGYSGEWTLVVWETYNGDVPAEPLDD